MSDSSSPVTAAHVAYLAARTRREDAFLTRLKEDALAAGIPPIWIAPEQASFLQILLKLGRAKRVVEVGTLAGYSAICMARALPPGGVVDTVEIEPRHADFAEERVRRSDVAGKVVVHRGAGAEILPRFAAASADAAFLDADKANYPLYLRECLRIVRKGGLILADNAFAFGQLFAPRPDDPGVPHIRRFNEELAATPGLHAVIVPLGDGMWVGVKE